MILFLRGAVSCALFVAFGAGALLLSPLMLILRRAEWCQPVVRASWIPLVWLFVHTGLIRVDRGNLPNCRGTILVANHPSLIDVVLLTVLVPRTLSVAKHAVGHNPVMGVVARAIAVPVGADQIETLSRYLSKGWNILVFPEGTRSPYACCRGLAVPSPDLLHPFQRGAAQLALRTGAPIVCVGIGQSRRILAKHQPAWDMGSEPVLYRFRADAATVARPQEGEPLHAAAVRVTAELKRRVRQNLAANDRPRAGRPPCRPSDLAAVVPVFNPEPGLVPLVRELVARFGTVVVVDDGSVENAAAFGDLPEGVILLRHAVNCGKGRAMKTALAWLVENRPQVAGAVFADGDGQHRADDVARVAAACAESDRVVFGVRDFSRKGVPFRSWWGNRWTAVEVRLLHGHRLADTQTGLRAVPARLIPLLAELPGERFEYEAGWFGHLRRAGEPIREVPIETVYVAGNRASHYRPFRDTLLTQRSVLFSRSSGVADERLPMSTKTIAKGKPDQYRNNNLWEEQKMKELILTLTSLAVLTGLAGTRFPVEPMTVYRADAARDIQFYDADGRALAAGCRPGAKLVASPLDAATANAELKPAAFGKNGCPVDDPSFWLEASRVDVNTGSRVRVKKGGYAVSIPVPAYYDLKMTPDPNDKRPNGWPSDVFSQCMQRLWYDRDMKEISRCHSRHLDSSAAPHNAAYVRFLLPYNAYDNFNEMRLVRAHFGEKHPLHGKRNVKDSDLFKTNFFARGAVHPGEIVLDPHPDCREKYVAAELVREVRTVTKKTLPVVSKPTEGAAFRIHLGRKAAERAGVARDVARKFGETDGYAIRRKGRDVYVFGATPRGTIFGALKLLEKVSDFYWWRPDRSCGLSFTPRETLDFASVGDCDDKPVFKNRTFFCGCCPCNYGYDDWALHHGITRSYNPGAVFGADAYHAKCHGYFCVIGDNFLGLGTSRDRSRPELWGVVNGKRQVGATDGQPCYSNPKVVAETLKNVNRILDDPPEEWDAFEFAYSDSWQCCECAECLKPIKLPQGGELACKDKMGKDSDFRSTRTYLVANEIAKVVSARYPGKPTTMLAYIYTAAPPAVKLHPSIRVLYATYASAVMRLPSKEQAGGTDNWKLRTEQWCAREPQAMGMYEYYFTPCPAMFAEVAAENLKQMADVGGTFHVHTETGNDGQSPLYDVNALDQVLIMALFWNPYRDVAKLRSETLKRIYGPAAADMEEYYRLFAKRWFDKSFNKWMNCHTPAAEIYVDYIINAKIENQVYDCFERALKKAPNAAVKKQLERKIAAFRAMKRATGRLDVPAVPELAGEWKDPRSPQWEKAFTLKDFRDAVLGRDDPKPKNEDLRNVPPALSKTKTVVDFACDRRYLYWRVTPDANGGYTELRFTIGKYMEIHSFYTSAKGGVETGRIPMAAIRPDPTSPISFIVRRFDAKGNCSFGRGEDNKTRAYAGESGASFSQLCPAEDSAFDPSDSRKLGIGAKPPLDLSDPELANHPLKKLFPSSVFSTGGQGMRRVWGVPVYDTGFGYCQIQGVSGVKPDDVYELSGDRWCYGWYMPFVADFLDEKGGKISNAHFDAQPGPFKFRITCPPGTKSIRLSCYNSYIKSLKLEKASK